MDLASHQVIEIRVKVGQKVNEGDIVVVLEAMKVSLMRWVCLFALFSCSLLYSLPCQTEHTLRAPKSGTIAKIAAEAGSMCAEGTALVTFEEEEE
jgi:3-methylcrotonyl-CoA carboxylase alpha subunit